MVSWWLRFISPRYRSPSPIYSLFGLNFRRKYLLCISSLISSQALSKVIINEYEDGGLKMPNIQSFYKPLKMSWLHKLLDPPSPIYSLFGFLTLKTLHIRPIWRSNLLTLSVTDEGYFRNESWALNPWPTFARSTSFFLNNVV
jgi:hypothetical protein